jgi:hypothetical protein
MMTTAAKFAAVEAAPRPALDIGRLLQALLRAVDRLAPARAAAERTAPPPEWYRYAPF